MTDLFKLIGRNFISIALLVVGIAIGSVVVGKVNEVRDFFFPDTGAHVRSHLTIVDSITGIGKLVTVSSEVHTTDLKVEIKRGVFNLAGYSANHIAIGAIEAGINFEEIDEENLRFEDDAFTLILPAPIVTSCRIEYIDQNQQSFTLLPADWDMVRQIAQAEAIIGFAQDMIELGILERAAEEAAPRIADFIRVLTGKQAQVEFAPRSDEIALPESCLPIAPSGWVKDEDGAWKRVN